MLTIIIPDTCVDLDSEFTELHAETLANPYEVDGVVYLKDGKPLYMGGLGSLYADPIEATKSAMREIAYNREAWADFARDCERLGY
jgi:hypothetical protein